MNGKSIPYGRQHIDADDIAAVTNVLKGDYLTTGPAVEALERSFAEVVGSRHAVACANGTAALHMAAMALDLKPDDWVVVPAITFLATANAIRYAGAEVVFADVDPETGLIRAQDFEAALARAPRQPKAVFPVHIGGLACDLSAIAAVAKRHDVEIVEDACHALGTRGRIADIDFRIGDCRWSRMATFSAHPVKAFTMGEGGIVTLNDDRTALRLRQLRNHGMTREASEFVVHDQAFASDGTPNRWYYEMQQLGYNYRANDLQCALGLSQLGKLDRFNARRRDLVRRYEKVLREASIPGVSAVPTDERLIVGWHLFRLRIDFAALGCDKQTLMRRLGRHGIGTQVHYIPLYRQPYYRSRYGAMNLEGAEAYYSTTLSLPLFVDMNDTDVDRVVAALADSITPRSHA